MWRDIIPYLQGGKETESGVIHLLNMETVGTYEILVHFHWATHCHILVQYLS